MLSTPTVDALVRVWEHGRPQHVVDRALTILMAFSGRSRRELAELPIGKRDAMLLDCRARVFEAPLSSFAACPACGCGLEVDLTPNYPEADLPAEGAVVVNGQTIAFRSPTSADLAAIATCAEVQVARDLLIERCTSGAAPDADAIAAIERELEGRWSGSTGAFALECPACAHTWTVALDIGAFLWEEIAAFARQRLQEVDILARRYRWSEREILELSPARRRFYLELA